MISKSKLIGIWTVTLVLLVLGACIQGPWDYYPENPTTFSGVSVTGYAIAGKPIQDLCFERLLKISEEQTSAFAFYESAEIKITGKFDSTLQTISTLSLKARGDLPNCFVGDSTKLIQKGEHYILNAKITWDSAGQKVTSQITGNALVPTLFKIHRDAAAPGIARTGGVPETINSLAFVKSLPPQIQVPFFQIFGDSINKYQDDSDTTALKNYFAANQNKMQNILVGLIGQQEKYIYKETDTLFYLNGALNTLSHYFSSDRSSDVGAVLITQKFDTTTERPETRFDAILGLKPDSSRYYFPGDHRRLLIYPDGKSARGWRVFDSLGVVNTWFHTGKNRLYFYGMEAAYYNYLATATKVQGGGGGSDGDSRVKIKYNVEGGQGVFVGGVVDTFLVNIKVDPLTKAYSTPAAHAYACREKDGWYGSKDCRGYYRTYCKANNWKPLDCGLDKIQVLLEGALKGTIPDSIVRDSIPKITLPDTGKAARLKEPDAERHICAEQNFATPIGNSNDFCKDERDSAFSIKGVNGAKQALWNYCLDHDWKPAQCDLGLVSYCTDKPRLSETLCQHADSYCKAHPMETLCK